MSRLAEAMERYLTIGEKLGLKGAELKFFITEQQESEKAILNEERDSRAKARSQEQDETENDKQRKHDLEIARLAHELEMRMLEVKSSADDDDDASVHSNTGAASPAGSSRRYFGPKIPPFNEIHDSMDSYLQRFEQFAEGQKWAPDIWAQYLSALLKGKALDVYGRLPADQAKVYALVKDALLKRFQLTKEGFKTTFYASKVETGESPAQFSARLGNYLTRWIEMSGTERPMRAYEIL